MRAVPQFGILHRKWPAWLDGRYSGKRAMAGWTLPLLIVSLCQLPALAAHFSYHAELEKDVFSVSWTPQQEHITFEVQVKTLGYVALGFSRDGQMPGADVVVGWVKHGQVFFQDRWCEGRYEPLVDPSQDYELLLGYENGTHTVLRFRRRLDTCDDLHDLPITSGTMRVVWSYGSEDGVSYHGKQHRGSRSLYLLDGPHTPADQSPHLHWDITNKQVQLPYLEDALYWCQVISLPNLRQKNHVVRFEPLVEKRNTEYVYLMKLHECHGEIGQLEAHARTSGQLCHSPQIYQLNCNRVVFVWTTGSEGLIFPPEAGYPLDPAAGPHYYMLETHYNNPAFESWVVDNSGLRLHYTKAVRRHDTGVLSVGLDHNWRHIIPPGQPEVVSEGHCISECTRSLPQQGISLFAVLLHTHRIATKVRFRQLRDGEELPPIAVDNSIDPNYQENHHLDHRPKVYAGDHLIAECVYNSSGRSTITLGGLTIREEKCLVFAFYYPRTELTICHSLPSLPTVLHSLGIEQLYPDSNPVAIKSPPDLADMTLEQRLVTYDWENNFDSFQQVTHQGSFKPVCLGLNLHHEKMESMEVYAPNITKPYKDVSPCNGDQWKPRRRKKPEEEEDGVNLSRDPNKIYNNVGVQESSTFNYCDRSHISVLLLFLAWSAILFCR